MTPSRRASRALDVVLVSGLLLWVSPLRAEDPTAPSQQIKPPQRAQDQKTQEIKNLPPVGHKSGQESQGKEPQTEEAPNNSVRSLILTVKLGLLADERTAASAINVESKGQEVTLSGKVSSHEEKLAIADVARHTEGVKSVVDKVEVVAELRQAMTQKRDQIITEYVKDKFKKSATLEAANFDVKTENGVVELTGKTRFQVIVLEAAETAKQIPGVKAVKSSAVRIEGAE